MGPRRLGYSSSIPHDLLGLLWSSSIARWTSIAYRCRCCWLSGRRGEVARATGIRGWYPGLFLNS